MPGFDPGLLLVPETGVLFLGAGERLLAYGLDQPRRLWEDTAEVGFWGWGRFGETVLMSAELELAAWDTSGRKLWTTSVEPPLELPSAGRNDSARRNGAALGVQSGARPGCLTDTDT